MEIQNKKNWGSGRGGGDVRVDVNRKLKFLWKFKKKKKIVFFFVFFFLGGAVGSVGGSGWGVRVDVNGDVKFL